LLKRLMDVVVSAVLIVLLLPVGILLGIAILLFDGWPVLYRQTRVGRRGRLFQLLKFRSMRPHPANAESQITRGSSDPRITRPGRYLRRFKLDELPQFVNVLKGDMSLVGPRPEVPKFILWDDEKQKQVLEARPGLTDPAILHGHFDEAALLEGQANPEEYYARVLAPAKLALNADYVRNRSIWLDLTILAGTAARLLGVRQSGH
jgi:lipopolysaccharide/colanic/teichoic acid biosynthesis glycosyltransferase